MKALTLMRSVTVEANQIVIREGGATIRYRLTIVRKMLKKIEAELAIWREYERLLTLDAPAGVDNAEGVVSE